MISCVITTYKRPISVLRRAVESVLQQSYSDIELIVVNDAPYEEMLEKEICSFLSSYGKRKIQYIPCWERKGACAARNMGLAAATGEYIAFLDDDDEWVYDKLAKELKLLEDTQSDLVYCSHYEIQTDGSKKIVREQFAYTKNQWNDFEKLLCYNYVGSTSYPLIRMEALKEVGGFTVGLKSSQDHDVWLKIAKKYKMAYLDEPLVNYFVSEDSISKSMTNKLAGYDYLLEKYKKEYSENRDILSFRLNYLSYCCFKFKDIRHFVFYYRKAIKNNWCSRYNFMIIKKMIDRFAKSKEYME